MPRKRPQREGKMHARAATIGAATFAVLFCGVALSAEVSGVAQVSDGDTLAIGGVKIRLEGIDAPETDQVCLDEQGDRWTCGIEARNQLAARIGSEAIACRLEGADRYGRSLGTCFADGMNLNSWMVAEGWALAFVRYSRAYVAEEGDARTGRRGMWQGAFIAPWDWRHRDRKTTVLGTLAVPVTAQAELLAPASSAGAPSTECIIKGNVNRRGERIYHQPGQSAYGLIKMDGRHGRRWFCTPEEAKADGWRPALR